MSERTRKEGKGVTVGLVLSRYDADAARERFDELVTVYLDAYGGSGPNYTEERYRRQLLSHLNVTGFTLVAAEIDGRIVGYMYGFPASPHSRTWEGLLAPVPADLTREDGSRSFSVCELMVRRGWKRRGVAEALHDELLAGRPEERATLYARPDNAPAQAAYAKWGWHKVAQVQPSWDNAPVFDVLVRRLGRQKG
jgi:ribosomal protein S18 acetylase RimI-like enzyme